MIQKILSLLLCMPIFANAATYRVELENTSLEIRGEIATSTAKNFVLENLEARKPDGEWLPIKLEMGFGAQLLNPLCDEASDGIVPYAASYGAAESIGLSFFSTPRFLELNSGGFRDGVLRDTAVTKSGQGVYYERLICSPVDTGTEL